MRNQKSIFSLACVLLAAGAFAQTTNQAPTYAMQTIYQFPLMGPANEGINPQGLILGLDGNLYGVTADCLISANCAGTFFRLTLAGALTTLHTFTNAPMDTRPNPSLAMDSSGTIYGLTDDSAFSVTPDGVYTLLGTVPTAGPGAFSFRLNGLVYGGDGDLYGTTVGTGTNQNQGMLFQLTPTGQMTEITTFDGMPSLMVPGPGALLYGLVFGNRGGTTFVSVTYDGVVTPLATITTTGIGNPIGFAPVLAGGNFYVEGSDTLIRISPSGGVTAPPSLLGAWGSSNPVIAGSDGNIYLLGAKMLYQISSSLQATILYTGAFSTCNTLVQGPNAFYCTATGTAGANGNGGVVYELMCQSNCAGSSSSGGSAPPVNPKGLGHPSNVPGNFSRGDPISAGNGNMFDEVTDYQTTGPNQLTFTRYYNSLTAPNTFAVTLGGAWRSNYDRYLRLSSATSVTAERADGQQVLFTLTNGAWTTDTDIDLKLTNSGSTWTLTDQEDTVESYSAASGSASGSTQALLQSIRARNGYTQTMQYTSGAQLTAVTDSFNRKLSLTYGGGKLQSVATPDGLVLTYGYTGAHLTSVGYSTSPPTQQTYLYENAALPSALTGVIDENGNRYATWTYDSSSRAITGFYAGGANLTRISYNDTDGSRTITNALGEQEVWKFTTLQGVPKVTEMDRTASGSLPAATTKFTYDSNGYTASLTDWNGNLTTFVNDLHGQPTTINQAVGTPQARATTVTYHASFHLPLKVVTPGLTTTSTYDANGELLTKTLTDTTTASAPYSTGGQTRTWTYTWSNFLPASAQSPRTDVTAVTKFTYDASGALTATSNALGQTTRITQHLPGGLPQTIIDPNGVSTTLTYEARLRLLSSTVATVAGPITTTYAYDSAGNRTSVTFPDGSALTNTYDAAHRLTGVTDLLHQNISYTLDPLGDLTRAAYTDASGALQRMHSGRFDQFGRLVQEIGGAGQTTSYTYDANSNAIAINDPLNHARQRAFDALNRNTTVTDAAGGVTTTSYDANDRPISLTDPNGAVTTHVYNGFGELIQVASPDAGTTVYRYDPDGNLAQKVDGNGATVNYTYDALDRVTSATYPADKSESVTYTYDQGSLGIGRLTSVADAAGSERLAYDERGNVLSDTRVNGMVTLATGYTYDAASRVASITYPSGWSVAYTRDMMGRVVSVTAQAANGGASIPVLGSVGYQPFGPVNAMMFGNGVAETRSFDLDYRVTALADAGTASLQNLTYSYDAADNVLSITDGVTAANSRTLSYDVLNRLTSVSGSPFNQSYTYDAAGNRLGMSVGVASTTLGYTPQTNQFISVMAGAGRQAFGYDKAGNVASFSPTYANISSMLYNQAGRLATVMGASKPLAQYTYDAFGQRLGKVGAATTLYQYDRGGHLLEEADGQGNPLVDYIFLDSMPIATISPSTGQVYFLHDDRLGTPQAASDNNQNVAWLADYGPFGELVTIPSLIVQNLRLPGQEFDSDTGLYHNGFRDYMPAWGRYLESDPIGLAGGPNTYVYSRSNPAGSTDPSGLSPQRARPVNPFGWPSWPDWNRAMTNLAKITTVVTGPLGGWSEIAHGLSMSELSPFKIAPLPLGALNFGLAQQLYEADPNAATRTSAALAYAAWIAEWEVKFSLALGEYVGEPLGEYDVQGFYNAAAHTWGRQQVNFFLAAPIDYITANVKMRMNPDSAANARYAASPGNLSVFY